MRRAPRRRLRWQPSGEPFKQVLRFEADRPKLGLYADADMTLEQYAEKRFPQLGYTTLKRKRAVAVRFTWRSGVKHGMHKLALGLEHIDLTPADERPAELLVMDVVLGDRTKRPFARCTPVDLESAIAALKTGAGDASERAIERLARAAGARLKQIEQELGPGIPQNEPPPHVTHRVVRRDARGRRSSRSATFPSRASSAQTASSHARRSRSAAQSGPLEAVETIAVSGSTHETAGAQLVEANLRVRRPCSGGPHLRSSRSATELRRESRSTDAARSLGIQGHERDIRRARRARRRVVASPAP